MQKEQYFQLELHHFYVQKMIYFADGNDLFFQLLRNVIFESFDMYHNAEDVA